MIQARLDKNGETVLFQERGHPNPGNGLQFVRCGSEKPYDMVEFRPEGAFFIPRVRPISWVCLSVEQFLEYMEDTCRKEKGFFNPPI